MVEVIDDPDIGAVIVPKDKITDPMLKNLLDIEDMKRQLDMQRLSGQQSEEKIQGYYSEIGANTGAYVIVVEGEDWEWENTKYKRMAILGHFYKAVEISGGLLRVQFTTIDGATTKDGRWRREWDEHPLSARRGGYIVPKRGGFAVMNDGWVILLSKFGLLSGKNAWEFSEEARKLLFRERQRVEQLQEQVEDRNAQLQTMEEETMQIGVERDSIYNEMRDIRSSLILAQNTVNRLKALSDSLMSEMENWQDLDTYRRTTLQKWATDMNKTIESILMFVSVQRIDESLRAGASEHPRLTENLKQQMFDELKRQGLAGKSDLEKEVERLKRELAHMKSQPPPQDEGDGVGDDEGGDDDDGEGGGSDTEQGDSGDEEGGQDDGSSGGKDGTQQTQGQSGSSAGAGDGNSQLPDSPPDTPLGRKIADGITKAARRLRGA